MAKNILIRNVPDDLHTWIEEERYRRRMTKQDFICTVLESACSSKQPVLFDAVRTIPQPAPSAIPFTFVDMFAGIGGCRLALQKVGGRCLFSCEWDPNAQKTYYSWFGETPHGDIRKLKMNEIPDHDILAAGFPCQPFSIAGVSKKKSLGRDHGFKDLTQGTLFFNVATIVEHKRPPVLLLENVKNLLSHDKGRTWEVILKTLTALNYVVFHKIIDAASWVPQHRERILIVCFDRFIFGDNIPFQFPTPPKSNIPKLRDILEDEVNPKYTLSNHLWSYLQEYAKKHREKGNGFGFGLSNLDGVARTLSARYYKDGSEILIPQDAGRNPRRLTPREAARLMGFPDDREIVVSDTQAYRQFGNAVVPAVIEAVGKRIVEVLHWYMTAQGNGCFIKGRLAMNSAKVCN